MATTRRAVQVTIFLDELGPFNELVIDTASLGLFKQPDALVEISGNARMLDPTRPANMDGKDVHVFFDPPLQGGLAYGFNFLFSFNDAVLPLMSQAEVSKA
jgi:hypothetical protein